jgi:prepilin-type N-terminal cleavage/methylation domain-containing protein
MMTNIAVRLPALGSVYLPMTTTPASVTRRGFSLVEMLVVLAIIATMAGLVLSGLFSKRDSNRLLAAEHVLADFIRQARHTARSSGSPVELRLTPTLSGSEVVGAKLGGVTRVCLWSETFDKERDTDDDGVIDPLKQLPEPGEPANGVVVGRSGNGWRPSLDFPILPHELTRGSTLVRGSRTDGFYLACSVLLPAKPSGIIPLVLIGDDEAQSNGQCLLAFQGRGVTIQGASDSTASEHGIVHPISSPVVGSDTKVQVWDLVGVIHNNNGVAAINSVLDAVTSRMGVEALPSGEIDIPRPIVGGRWVDVGLLYDGKRMVLYCDGERVAQRSVGANSQLKVNGNFIFLGSVLDDLVSPPSVLYANVPLDDARLYRLGTADLGELPGSVVLVSAEGVKPDKNLGYRILCQPDGRVEVSRDGDANGTLMNDPLSTNPQNKVTTGSRAGERATITIGQLRTPGTLQAAEITITLDGRVTSRLLTPQGVAPK